MNAKKWVTITTFLCTLMAVVLLLIFKWRECDIGYDIALAVFGSALLGFVMSLIEYYAERRRAMEDFWKEARHVLLQLRRAKYIKFSEPEELVVSCIVENYENKLAREYDPQIAKAFGIEESYENKNRYIQWMEEHEVLSFSEDDDISAILDEIYLKRMEKYEILIKSVIDNYIELSQISLSELDSAYRNLNFICANKTIRLKAYNEIFNKIRTIRNKVCTETLHFNLWKEDKGNFAVCVSKVIGVRKMLFVEKIREENGVESVSVYQKQFDDIEESLEKFRVHIFFGAKKQPIVRKPMFSKIKNIDN